MFSALALPSIAVQRRARARIASPRPAAPRINGSNNANLALALPSSALPDRAEPGVALPDPAQHRRALPRPAAYIQNALARGADVIVREHFHPRTRAQVGKIKTHRSHQRIQYNTDP